MSGAVSKANIPPCKQVLKILTEALEDMRDFGCRHDLNPTGMFHECGHFEVWSGGGGWHAYLQSADARVRERASLALAAARAHQCGEECGNGNRTDMEEQCQENLTNIS